MNCRLITGLLCELCFYNKLIVDMLNEEIIYNYFESIFVAIIISSLLMKGNYFFLFANYTNVLVSFLFSSLLTRCSMFLFIPRSL